MLNMYINHYENKPPFIHKNIFQTLSDQFHRNSFQIIGNEQSKLRTYAKFKTEIGQEKYLSTIKNHNIRKFVTKFRLSNHTRADTTKYQKTIDFALFAQKPLKLNFIS